MVPLGMQKRQQSLVQKMNEWYDRASDVSIRMLMALNRLNILLSLGPDVWRQLLCRG